MRARTLPVRCSEPGSPHPRSCRLSAAQAGSLAYQRPRSRADVASALPYVLFLSYPLFWFLGIPWLWGTHAHPADDRRVDLGHQARARSTRVLDLGAVPGLAAAVGRAARRLWPRPGHGLHVPVLRVLHRHDPAAVVLQLRRGADPLEPAGEGRCVPVGHDDHPGHAGPVVPGIHPAHAREQGAAQRSDEHPAGRPTTPCRSSRRCRTSSARRSRDRQPRSRSRTAGPPTSPSSRRSR